MSNKVILVDAINAFVIKGEGIFQPMYDLLETYSNKKIILTGADNEQMKKFGLDKMPYEVFSLHHDPEKTDPLYFTKMLQAFNLTADNVIYFEHNEDAVKSAVSVEILTHYYDKDERDINALKNFLDKNL